MLAIIRVFNIRFGNIGIFKFRHMAGYADIGITCQRLLYRYTIPSPLYSAPSDVMTIIQPALSSVSAPIWCWVLDAFLVLRFLAFSA